jgi:putative two-component system response regulator
MVYERTNNQTNKLIRIKSYIKSLCEYLRGKREYAIELNDESIKMMCSATSLYDMGMISVAESILYKPGKLTSEEMHTVKGHCVAAKVILERGSSNMAYYSKFFTIASDMALYHHEKWNGNGYPYGITGNKIPLAARILCVCDSYDAIVRETAYSAASPHMEAVEAMIKEREKQFDPAILDAFLAIHAKFQEIALMYAN